MHLEISRTLALKIVGIAIQLLASLLIISKSGFGLYGEYVFLLSIILAFAIVGMGGYEHYIIYKASNIQRKSDAYKIITEDAISVSMLNALLALSGMIVYYIISGIDANIKYVVMASTVPIIILNQILTEGIKATDEVDKSIKYSQIYPQLGFLIGIYLCEKFLINLESYQLLFIYLMSISFVTVWLYISMYMFMDKKLKNKYWILRGYADSKSMYSYSLSSLLTGHSMNIALGAVLEPKSFGVYSLLARVYGLAGVFMSVVNSFVGPTVAKLHINDKTNELQKFYKWVNIRLIAVGVITFIFSVYLYYQVEGFLPKELQGIKMVIWCFSVAAMINISTGPVNTTIIMTGLSGFLAKYNLIVSMPLVALSYVLSDLYELNGAAIAYLILMIISNVPLLFILNGRRKLRYL